MFSYYKCTHPTPRTDPKSTLDPDTVTIRVGDPNRITDFTVKFDLICSVSPYFRSAFKGEFREATSRFISLRDVTKTTFWILLQWAKSQAHDFEEDVLIPEMSSLPNTSRQTVVGQGACMCPMSALVQPRNSNAKTVWKQLWQNP